MLPRGEIKASHNSRERVLRLLALLRLACFALPACSDSRQGRFNEWLTAEEASKKASLSLLPQ